MFIMRLLATTSVADDRITFTSGTSPQNNFGATRGPICFEVVRRCGKWDKQNRTSLELCLGLTCQDLSRKRSSFLLKQKSNWKRITLLACSSYGCDSEYWPVIIDNPDRTCAVSAAARLACPVGFLIQAFSVVGHAEFRPLASHEKP